MFDKGMLSSPGVANECDARKSTYRAEGAVFEVSRTHTEFEPAMPKSPAAILMAMAIPWRVENLDIVGYADALDETMLPSIVPPVFRLRSEPRRHFLPPYFFNVGCLHNATEVDAQEIRELSNNEKITVFDKSFPAQVRFELYIDQKFQPQYKSREVINSELRAIAVKHIAEAQAALSGGSLDEANRLAGIAISADDLLVEPFVIMAAIHRAKHDVVGEQLIASLAPSTVTESSFQELVDAMSSSFRNH